MQTEKVPESITTEKPVLPDREFTVDSLQDWLWEKHLPPFERLAMDKLLNAEKQARALNHKYIHSAHILLAIVGDRIVKPIRQSPVTYFEIEDASRALLSDLEEKLVKVPLPIYRETAEMLVDASWEAYLLPLAQTSMNRVLRAIMRDEDTFTQDLLDKLNIDREWFLKSTELPK